MPTGPIRIRSGRLPAGSQGHTPPAFTPYFSVLGMTEADTPMVIPIRANLDAIKRLMIGDYYIGRGSRQRGLSKSIFCNTHKVSAVGRDRAIQLFERDLSGNSSLYERLWTLSGLRLVCHCTPNQACHADVLIRKFREKYPGAYDRTMPSSIPSASVLNYLAALREDPPSDPGSSADEGAPPAGSGWVGAGNALLIGTGYTAREYCDGQSLASPGRWPPSQRNYPTHPEWTVVSSAFKKFTDTYGTPELLVRLALGKVDSCPFGTREISELKADIVTGLKEYGLELRTSERDRQDVLLDYRFIELLLVAARDPEVAIGSFAEGVRVGPGVRLPRLPALYKAKKKWRLPEQSDPLLHMEKGETGEHAWRNNYPAVASLSAEVTEVLEDQARRGQVLKLSECDARREYPDLVVASLGANKKEKPGGIITARVLHDGTNGISVNRRIRVRDQERFPTASDVKRAMREKAALGERSFALTADVKEAHRQVPIAPQDLASFRLPGHPGVRRIHQQGGYVRHFVSQLLLVESRVVVG